MDFVIFRLETALYKMEEGDFQELSAGDARYTLPSPREARLKNPNL